MTYNQDQLISFGNYLLSKEREEKILLNTADASRVNDGDITTWKEINKVEIAIPKNLVTPADCIKRFGIPAPANEGKYMVLWQVPEDIQAAFAHVRFSATGTLGFPKRIYCNKLLPVPLEKALRNMMERGLASKMRTWDGCFFLRKMRGGTSYSLHSWGLAVDRDASTNQMGQKPTLTPEDVKCWTDAGFHWGGDWNFPDGMHMQLASI